MAKAIIIDVQAFDHLNQGEQFMLAAAADLQRIKADNNGADTVFRSTFMASSIALSRGDKTAAEALELLGKAGTLVRKPADKETEEQWKERQATRRAAVKAGEIIERTKQEQALYNAAKKKMSDWFKRYGLTPVQQRDDEKKRAKQAKLREEQAAKVTKDRLAKPSAELTPAANSVTSADKFLRQQAAMMLAYCEKNWKLVAPSARDAVAELYEAFKAIPQADDEAAE